MAEHLDALWRTVHRQAATADPAAVDRAAGCLAVALSEIVLSARVPAHRAAAEALAAAPGPCRIGGVDRLTDLTGAVTANAYLMHARLTDDSYRVAAHPGLAVVPVALAVVERDGVVSGERLLRAVIGGYECACRLAEALLPDVSRRGWRVTSVVAPLAAAATYALVTEMSEDDAVAALALATGTVGGPLGVVATDGDGWRLQPALAVQAGVSAAIAAGAGLRGGDGALAGPSGMYSLFGTGRPAGTSARAAIHDVTFKRYPVAMYGQSIFDAFRSHPALPAARRVTVRVAPFAVDYGRDAAVNSISSVEGIARAALRAFHPAVTPEAVEVVADPALPDLSATVTVTLADGADLTLTGDGDTSAWRPADLRAHCADLLGDTGDALARASAALRTPTGLADLAALWRTAR
ncbi:MmgE/PrpD family protein [Saccharothrix sp. 6-C]|uniref:MmgE/PrpD family protein n=1 Tax=Saccharothrix sp. 6-C TaxID=2781735 RepID=UPI001916DEAD|nr:MmgE/PrpD family protein [Saccharothrix sp. 6-C]QQQ78716.1 MmgE/PrpD family protein [Saccharothrix sp. 6-C]